MTVIHFMAATRKNARARSAERDPSSMDDSYDEVADAAATVVRAINNAMAALASDILSGKIKPYTIVNGFRCVAIPWGTLRELSDVLHSLRTVPLLLRAPDPWLEALRMSLGAKRVEAWPASHAGLINDASLPFQCIGYDI